MLFFLYFWKTSVFEVYCFCFWKKGYVVKIFFSLLIFFATFSALGQDVEFSQFSAAPLRLNPALAGMAFGPRVNLNYRNQWPSIQKGYVSYAASFDMHVNALSGGIGVFFMADRIANGLLNNYSVNVMYSFHARLSRKLGLKIGAQGGYTYKDL